MGQNYIELYHLSIFDMVGAQLLDNSDDAIRRIAQSIYLQIR